MDRVRPPFTHGAAAGPSTADPDRAARPHSADAGTASSASSSTALLHAAPGGAAAQGRGAEASSVARKFAEKWLCRWKAHSLFHAVRIRQSPATKVPLEAGQDANRVERHAQRLTNEVEKNAMPTLLRNIEKLLGVWDDPGKSPNERNAALRAFKKYHGHLFRYATEDDSQIVAALRPIKRRLDDGGLQQCPPGELKRMPLTHGRIPD